MTPAQIYKSEKLLRHLEAMKLDLKTFQSLRYNRQSPREEEEHNCIMIRGRMMKAIYDEQVLADFIQEQINNTLKELSGLGVEIA